MAVYSKLLGRGNPAGAGTVTAFTAVAGLTTIVRSVQLLSVNPTTQVLVFIAGNGTLAGLEIPGAATTFQTFDLRAVLAPGDVVQLFTAGGGCQYYISGYELTP